MKIGSTNPWYIFGTVAVVVVAAATFAIVSSNSPDTNDSPNTNDSPDSNAVGGEALDPYCELVKFVGGDVDVLAGMLSDPPGIFFDFPNVSQDDLALCLDPYQAVVIVEGVPGVSGIYTSLAGNVALTGYGLGSVDGKEGLYFEHGKCFVGDPGEPFRTQAIYTRGVLSFSDVMEIYPKIIGYKLTPEEYEELVAANTLTLPGFVVTIDVGVTEGGERFMAIVVNSPEKIEANFTSNSEIEGTSNRTEGRENPWAGKATFSTTTYNNRDFFPYEERVYTGGGTLWEGAPSYDMTITVLCG